MSELSKRVFSAPMTEEDWKEVAALMYRKQEVYLFDPPETPNHTAHYRKSSLTHLALSYKPFGHREPREGNGWHDITEKLIRERPDFYGVLAVDAEAMHQYIDRWFSSGKDKKGGDNE